MRFGQVILQNLLENVLDTDARQYLNSQFFMKKVAIVGIQGLPANYGGFETMVENIIGDNASKDVLYTVYCSSKDMKSSVLKEYKGARLKYLNIPSHGIWSIPYYTLSMLKCMHGYDTILMLGCGGGFMVHLFKFISKAKLLVNVDGVEWRREKWGKAARWLIRTVERLCVAKADLLIADNKGIQDYLIEEYGKSSVVIAYGGDTVLRDVSKLTQNDILEKYGIKPANYAISVCRIEPENNCHLTLGAFSQTQEKLVFIGNWERSEYGRKLKNKYAKFENIKIVDPVYDLDVLYALRSNAKMYIHGHSAGGTNPSLVEAMFFGIPIYAYDCVYNIASTYNKAHYFHTEEDLKVLLFSLPNNGEEMKKNAWEHYTWKKIAEQYEELY